jgi:DNA repair protein RadC
VVRQGSLVPDTSAPIVIADPRAAAALLAGLADAAIERAVVLYLDPDWTLLGRSDFTGDAETVTPPLRAIIAEALRLDAAALVLAHNHPRGSTMPSAADMAYTRALARVAEALGLVLADHLIIAGTEVTSLREAGLM